MKRTTFSFLSLLAALLLLTGCRHRPAVDSNFHIFLCLGQSNMEGNAPVEATDTLDVPDRFLVMCAADDDARGRQCGQWYHAVPPLCDAQYGLCPADGFGRTMLEALPADARVGVINVSVGGIDIRGLLPDSAAAYATTVPDWMRTKLASFGNDPYQRLVDVARRAQRDGVIRGILLHQGESNTGDERWLTWVEALYRSLLRDLNLRAEECPLLAGEVVSATEGGVCASMNDIIDRLPEVIPTAHVVRSDYCESREDHLHFSAAGYRELGLRYARSMLPLMGLDVLPTFTFHHNPLVRSCYTADPAPVVFGDRLYLYTGHDECFEDSVGYEGLYGFNITDWHCFSTADMHTWTEHGAVLRPADFSWASGEAWAAQVVEHDGRYWYFVSTQCASPNCKAIGVAVADSPTGPFRDAIGRPLIVDSMTPNAHPLGWWNDIDPTVFIDDDGTPWLSWGNGTCFLVRLKTTMTEMDDSIMILPMENYVEGPWLYKRRADDGTDWWYMVYASMNHGTETISYAMAPAVTGPWTFQGELTGAAEHSFTIHPGVIDFQGKSYLFYHNSTLSLHGYGPATGRRSVCVNEMHYNPDGTIQPVEQR